MKEGLLGADSSRVSSVPEGGGHYAVRFLFD